MATAHFNEENSADIVIGQNANAKDERLQQVMEVITRHLHAAVKEIEPTQEEWMQAIQFLTATGHKCDDWRQEYILLSDVLGVSMLVDAINSRRPAGASENTVLGPFHIGGTPEYEMGTNICLDGKGEDMLVRGRVLDIDGNPLEGVKIDVWQANDEGFYDVHRERPFFGELTTFMSRGPVIVLALEAEEAIEKWRGVIGSTNPAEAADGSIRKLYGKDVGENATHGSDAPETAAREIGYFFAGCEVRPTA